MKLNDVVQELLAQSKAERQRSRANREEMDQEYLEQGENAMNVLKPVDTIAGFQVRTGTYSINGATEIPGGVNFTIYSLGGTACELVLYHRKDKTPFAVIPIPDSYRIGKVWSIIVFGLNVEDFQYSYRVDGPWDPAKGLLFDKNRELLDPYARAVVGMFMWGED